MKLVVFDLDHTLVDVFWLHDEVTDTVFRRLFNRDAWLHEIDHAGRSLPENFRVLAAAKGITEAEFNAASTRIMDEYDREFAARIPTDISRNILPGAAALLERLSTAGIDLALYTGDSRTVAESILASARLDRYFGLRFFGTEFPSRTAMVEAAIQAVNKKHNLRPGRRDIVVIGDSTRDVEAGKTAGAVTIAVATGQHRRSELERSSPDLVVDSLQEQDAILAAIDGTRL